MDAVFPLNPTNRQYQENTQKSRVQQKLPDDVDVVYNTKSEIEAMKNGGLSKRLGDSVKSNVANTVQNRLESTRTGQAVSQAMETAKKIKKLVDTAKTVTAISEFIAASPVILTIIGGIAVLIILMAVIDPIGSLSKFTTIQDVCDAVADDDETTDDDCYSNIKNGLNERYQRIANPTPTTQI